jgi:hypothetical protein
VNHLMRELGPISPAVRAFPLAASAVAALRAGAESQGSGEFSPLWSGQNASGCKELPAAELTRELAAGLKHACDTSVPSSRPCHSISAAAFNDFPAVKKAHSR